MYFLKFERAGKVVVGGPASIVNLRVKRPFVKTILYCVSSEYEEV